MLYFNFVFFTCSAAIFSNHLSALIADIFKYDPKVNEICQNITSMGRQKTSKFFIDNLVCCYYHACTYVSFSLLQEKIKEKKVYDKFTPLYSSWHMTGFLEISFGECCESLALMGGVCWS